MTDPWCWYINANIKGAFVDGIHGTPYIAAPLGSGKYSLLTELDDFPARNGAVSRFKIYWYGSKWTIYPLVNVQKNMERSTMFNW